MAQNLCKAQSRHWCQVIGPAWTLWFDIWFVSVHPQYRCKVKKKYFFSKLFICQILAIDSGHTIACTRQSIYQNLVLRKVITHLTPLSVPSYHGDTIGVHRGSSTIEISVPKLSHTSLPITCNGIQSLGHLRTQQRSPHDHRFDKPTSGHFIRNAIITNSVKVFPFGPHTCHRRKAQ